MLSKQKNINPSKGVKSIVQTHVCTDVPMVLAVSARITPASSMSLHAAQMKRTHRCGLCFSSYSNADCGNRKADDQSINNNVSPSAVIGFISKSIVQPTNEPTSEP